MESGSALGHPGRPSPDRQDVGNTKRAKGSQADGKFADKVLWVPRNSNHLLSINLKLEL